MTPPVLYLTSGPETERQLIAALKRGDRDSYQQLYERYAPKVLRILRRTFRDEAVARDALQATFMTVFEKIDRFDERSSLATWLARIAVRKALRQVHKARPIDLGWSEEEPQATPEQENIQQQRLRRLQTLVDALPTEKRLALLLFEIEGFSVQEIADITGEPRGTVLARLSRTRSELRDAMTAWEEGEVPEVVRRGKHHD